MTRKTTRQPAPEIVVMELKLGSKKLYSDLKSCIKNYPAQSLGYDKGKLLLKFMKDVPDEKMYR